VDPDRNAGFSSADPGKLYLPVIQSLVYHHNNVNVEAQMASSSSLLHWMRAMLRVRSTHPVFGLGDFALRDVDNEAVLAFTRTLEADPSKGREEAQHVLCLHNLSSRPQAGTVRLPERYAGAKVRDLFGGSGFPKVGPDAAYTVMLGSRDFFWLGLHEREQEGASHG
jgi:maltose alpha-D-glucosyltransferase/alpha-amylase